MQFRGIWEGNIKPTQLNFIYLLVMQTSMRVQLAARKMLLESYKAPV